MKYVMCHPAWSREEKDQLVGMGLRIKAYIHIPNILGLEQTPLVEKRGTEAIVLYCLEFKLPSENVASDPMKKHNGHV